MLFRSPNPVVNVVKNTGLNRCMPVWTIICCKDQSECSFFRTLKVSTRTILLFTIIPASATIPIPVSNTLKGWPVVSNPSKTPEVESNTEERINKDW